MCGLRVYNNNKSSNDKLNVGEVKTMKDKKTNNNSLHDAEAPIPRPKPRPYHGLPWHGRARPSGGNLPFLWRLIARRSRPLSLAPLSALHSPCMPHTQTRRIRPGLGCYNHKIAFVAYKPVILLPCDSPPMFPVGCLVAGSSSGPLPSSSSFRTNEKCCGLFSFGVFLLRRRQRRRSKHNLLH